MQGYLLLYRTEWALAKDKLTVAAEYFKQGYAIIQKIQGKYQALQCRMFITKGKLHRKQHDFFAAATAFQEAIACSGENRVLRAVAQFELTQVIRDPQNSQQDLMMANQHLRLCFEVFQEIGHRLASHVAPLLDT